MISCPATHSLTLTWTRCIVHSWVATFRSRPWPHHPLQVPLPLRLLLLAGAAAAPLAAQVWDCSSVSDIDNASHSLAAGDTIRIEPGTYQLDDTIQMNTANTTITGATSLRTDVVLVGGGMNTHGVDEGITVGANNVTIENLTATQFYYNGLHTRAEDNVQNTLIQNVKVMDCGERMIKGSRDPSQELVSGGMVIQDVLLVQDMDRSGHTDTDPDYIGGIDIMMTSGILIQRVTAMGIHGINNGGNAAIFLWNGALNPVIIDNTIIGCAKGISLGNPAAPGSFLPTGTYHAQGGLVANNTILRGSWETGNNIGIEMCSTLNCLVADNTVYSDDATYFRTLSVTDSAAPGGATSGLQFTANLVRGNFFSSTTSGTGWTLTGNLIDGAGTVILPDWFTTPDAGDFHLTSIATGAIGHGMQVSGITTDHDGVTRSVPGDLGAMQYQASGSTTTATGSTTSTGSGSATSTSTGTGTSTGTSSSTGTSGSGTSAVGTSGSFGGGGSGGSSGGCGLGSAGALLLGCALLRRGRARIRVRRASASLLLLLSLASSAWSANDETQANSYDAGWLSTWVSHCQGVYTTTGKVTGMVLEIGDSITHANPYAQWPRYGAQTAPDDVALCQWVQSAAWGASGDNTNTTIQNGWYLAAADTNSNRGMTASSGISTGEFLSGDGNGGTAMPALTDQTSAQTAVADGGTYTNNLNMTTVASAFRMAQFAVLMLGTNDSNQSVTQSTFIANITQIVGILEAQHIVVILSTIPPNQNAGTDALDITYNQGLASFAQSHGLPLIDFRAEILARQPEPQCFGTLIDATDVHPTGRRRWLLGSVRSLPGWRQPYYACHRRGGSECRLPAAQLADGAEAQAGAGGRGQSCTRHHQRHRLDHRDRDQHRHWHRHHGDWKRYRYHRDWDRDDGWHRHHRHAGPTRELQRRLLMRHRRSERGHAGPSPGGLPAAQPQDRLAGPESAPPAACTLKGAALGGQASPCRCRTCSSCYQRRLRPAASAAADSGAWSAAKSRCEALTISRAGIGPVDFPSRSITAMANPFSVRR